LLVNRLKENRKIGFSLIEAVIVLTIIGIVIGGLWAAVSTVRLKQQGSRAAQDLLYISGRIREAFDGLAPKSGADITYTAYLAKWVPEGWGYADGQLQPPMGRATMNLAPNTWDYDFVIDWFDMTESECRALVLALRSIIATNPKNFFQVFTPLDTWYDRANGFYVDVPSCAASVMKGYSPGMTLYINF